MIKNVKKRPSSDKKVCKVIDRYIHRDVGLLISRRNIISPITLFLSFKLLMHYTETGVFILAMINRRFRSLYCPHLKYPKVLSSLNTPERVFVSLISLNKPESFYTNLESK
jgi:hypothetical protein